MKKLIILLLSFVAATSYGQGLTIHKASTANAPTYSLGKMYFNTDSGRVMIGVGGVWKGTPFTSDVVGGSAGLADSMQIMRDSIAALRALLETPVLLDTTMKNDEDGLGLDWTSQSLLDSIAKYGADGVGEGGGGSGTVGSGSANRLAYYSSSGTAITNLAAITASRALASDASGLPVASTVTAAELAYLSGVTSAIQTQLNSKISGVNLGVDWNETTYTITNDQGVDAVITGASTTKPGVITAYQFARTYHRRSITSSTSTLTINIDLGGQIGVDLTTTTTARDLSFANQAAGDMVKIVFNNTAGGSITINLPSNSFVQNTTTGVYESASTITVPSGRTILTLSDFDGTNYLFVY